jgi:hypothetical protein
MPWDLTQMIFPRVLYIKGDGTVYASDVNLNAIGKYLYTSEPAVTTGSHFA